MSITLVKRSSFEEDLTLFEKDVLVDRGLLLKSFEKNSKLTFGLYNIDSDLEAIVSAFEFKNSILINSFYYKDSVTIDQKRSLIDTFVANAPKKSLIVMVSDRDSDMFANLHFKPLSKFQKVVYSKGSFAIKNSFHSAKDCLKVIKEEDRKFCNEDRFEYISKTLMKQSSLVISSDSGYQHSYALNTNTITISPWIMSENSNSEDLIQTLLYYRGVKKVSALIPKGIEKITNLYKSYKFDFLEDYTLMYLNEKPKLNLGSIYSF
jgi:hypothetical protein